MSIEKQGGSVDRVAMVYKHLREMGADFLWRKQGSRQGDRFDIECWRTNSGVILLQIWKEDQGFEIYYPTKERELDRVFAELARFGVRCEQSHGFVNAAHCQRCAEEAEFAKDAGVRI